MKRLIYRLSSLGDVILSQSALEVPYAGSTDWVTSKEFESLFAGNPKIARLWTFDRKREGFSGWWRLNLELARQGYDEVIDLHSSYRTRLARWAFRWARLRSGMKMPAWSRLKKDRWRRWGYLVFKRLWPSDWRPRALARCCALLAGGAGGERANLRHLVGAEPEFVRSHPIAGPFYVVMPASAWPGKQWPIEHYLEFIRQFSGELAVVTGTPQDEASRALVRRLRAQGIPHVDAIGKLNLRETAWLLSRARFLIANDTGLSHLAEAVGTPAIVFYGPTRWDFGFGVADPRSRALETDVWCSPCSKDGTLCYRLTNRFACLKSMPPSRALALAREAQANGGAG